MEISKYIPIGYKNRIDRFTLVERTGLDDRENRRLIQKSDAPIVCLDGGYFIPGPDELDKKQYYIRQEKKRAFAILKKLKKFNMIDGQMTIDEVLGIG